MTVIFTMNLFIRELFINYLPGVKHYGRSWDFVVNKSRKFSAIMELTRNIREAPRGNVFYLCSYKANTNRSTKIWEEYKYSYNT